MHATIAPSTGTPYRNVIRAPIAIADGVPIVAGVRRATLEALRCAEVHRIRKLALGAPALDDSGPRPRDIARAMVGVILGFQEDFIEEIVLVSASELLVKAIEAELA